MAYLLKQKKELLNSRSVFNAVLQITNTADSDINGSNGVKEKSLQSDDVNMLAVEYLLIDLSLWRESETFRFVLEHIIELIEDPYSIGLLKGRILNTQICTNLLRMIVDDAIKPRITTYPLSIV